MAVVVRQKVASQKGFRLGLSPLTVTVTTMGSRSYKNPLNKAPLRTVTGRGNDPRFRAQGLGVLQGTNKLWGMCWGTAPTQGFRI